MWFVWAIAGCAQPQLCRATGGEWDADCFSCNSNPTCADGEAAYLPCMAVCGEGCRCPSGAPIWDDTLGCQPASVCAETADAERELRRPDPGGAVLAEHFAELQQAEP